MPAHGAAAAINACRTPTRPSQAPTALRREAEDQARRAFLRTVSHELRTPLNAIIGFSEIIAREMHGPIAEPKYRAHAELVRDSGLKMLGLVNDILEIARLEAGAVDLDLRSECVSTAFADAMRGVEEQAAERGVTIVPRIEPAGLCVLADSRALADALRRLLQNAVAFSPKGGTVRLTAAVFGRSVRIEVQDDGPGMEATDIGRMMRPFQHGEDTAGRTSGAGLGLAVVNLLCKAMGGHVRLHACPGHGLTAAVRLPAA